MKTLGSIFLIFTIVYTTIGVRVNTHRCETKKMISYSIFDNNSCCLKKADCCPLPKKIDDCCSDKVSLVHLGQDIHFYPDAITPNQTFVGFNFTGFSYNRQLLNRFLSKKTKDRAPPLLFSYTNFQAAHQVYII